MTIAPARRPGARRRTTSDSSSATTTAHPVAPRPIGRRRRTRWPGRWPPGSSPRPRRRSSTTSTPTSTSSSTASAYTVPAGDRHRDRRPRGQALGQRPRAGLLRRDLHPLRDAVHLAPPHPRHQRRPPHRVAGRRRQHPRPVLRGVGRPPRRPVRRRVLHARQADRRLRRRQAVPTDADSLTGIALLDRREIAIVIGTPAGRSSRTAFPTA